MKLLHCKECDQYSKEAPVGVKVFVNSRLRDDGEWIFWLWDQYEFSQGEVVKDPDLSRLECPDCDGPLEIVDRDECPHKWESAGRDLRECQICETRQRAEMVWPSA